jgi:hypothetical protein
MTLRSIDDLFSTESGRKSTHPRVVRWQRLRADGRMLRLQVHRKWDGLTFAPARLFVTAQESDTDPGLLDEVLWEDELNQGLVELGVRAEDPKQEITRYALAFRSAFDPIKLRHGQDFIRAVTVEYLRESILGEQPTLKGVLDQIHTNKTSQGKSHEQAVDAIENIVKTKAHELKTKLKYGQDEAVTILSGALAQYLDEIFHLRTRNVWFSK